MAVMMNRMLMQEQRRRASTLDPKEVAKFTSFAKDFFWSSPDGRPLRSMNEIRIPLIRDSVRPLAKDLLKRTIHPLAGIRLVDIGSGGGLVSEPLARLGANVTGIDPVQMNVDTAIRHMKEESSDLSSRLKYEQVSVEAFASDDQNRCAFHAVVASEVLEHVEDVTLFLKSVYEMLKPGGKFILTTLNQTLATQVLAITVAENVLNIVPKGTHEYRKLVPMQGLILLLQETGFRMEQVTGMIYNPFTNTWSWSRLTSINYAVVAVKQVSS